MSIIIPANSAVGGGFDVANSLLINPGAKITHTFDSTTNRRTYTLSTWLKKCSTTTEQNFIFSGDNSGSNPYFDARFNSDQTINWYGSDSGSNEEFNLITNRKFTDPAAWYHIVMAIDTTQGTGSNRIKLYVNGVQETSFSKENYPGQNFEGPFNYDNYEAQYGGLRNNTPNYNGYYAEIVLIDGQQLAPTSFGEFDEDSGIWKPISVSGLTFGDNGYYLQFQDTANSGASLGDDSSGNSNGFSVTNIAVIDQSTDSCTNNSATINSLFRPDPSHNLNSISDGNLSFTTNSTSDTSMGVTTFGASSGKWYAEIKSTGESGTGEAFAGIGYDIFENATTSMNSGSSFMWDVCSNGDAKFGGSSQGANNWSNTYAANDIISIAMDLDNNRVYFAKNGQYADGSGNWDEAFTASPAYATITSDKTYFFCAGDKSTSQTASWSCNFGSPPYAVSSGNQDGNGYGNFEYAVPSGYYSLNTKNLAEYG